MDLTPEAISHTQTHENERLGEWKSEREREKKRDWKWDREIEGREVGEKWERVDTIRNFKIIFEQTSLDFSDLFLHVSSAYILMVKKEKKKKPEVDYVYT